MIYFKFEAFGKPAFAREFRHPGMPNIKDLRPAFEKIEKDFYKIEKEQFQTEGARGGAAWKPLTVRTIAIKDYMMRTRQAVSLKPLIRTGRMWAALTQAGSTSGKIRRVGPLEMELGTSVFYAIKHHEGQDGLSQREVIALTSADPKRWTNILQAEINKRIREAGTGTPAGSRFD